MATKAKPIPDGFHTLTPHLTVKNAERALDFYQKAFGAQVLNVSRTPDNRVMHATVRIGDSMLMLNDEFPEMGGTVAPGQPGNITIHAYVENVDDIFKKALAAGATQKMPLMDQFWGDRYGQVLDPFGIRWSLGTHIREVTPDEMKKAMDEMSKQMPQKKTA
jgi:uncharacterized glyoxalase superfamily protein PhnB